jgi:hypothetical protein
MAEVHVVPFEFTGTVDAGTSTFAIFRAPLAATGGGISIVAGGASSPSTMAVGSCPNLELVKSPVGGTLTTLNGTIASNWLGTVATNGFTASIVQTWTIATPFVDAGEYVCIKYGSPLANAGTAYANGKVNVKGYISYVMGR